MNTVSCIRSGCLFRFLRLAQGPKRRDGHCPPRSYGNVGLGDADGAGVGVGDGLADGGGVRRGFSVGTGVGDGSGVGSAVALGDGSRSHGGFRGWLRGGSHDRGGFRGWLRGGRRSDGGDRGGLQGLLGGGRFGRLGRDHRVRGRGRGGLDQRRRGRRRHVGRKGSTLIRRERNLGDHPAASTNAPPRKATVTMAATRVPVVRTAPRKMAVGRVASQERCSWRRSRSRIAARRIRSSTSGVAGGTGRLPSSASSRVAPPSSAWQAGQASTWAASRAASSGASSSARYASIRRRAWACSRGSRPAGGLLTPCTWRGGPAEVAGGGTRHEVLAGRCADGLGQRVPARMRTATDCMTRATSALNGKPSSRTPVRHGERISIPVTELSAA